MAGFRHRDLQTLWLTSTSRVLRKFFQKKRTSKIFELIFLLGAHTTYFEAFASALSFWSLFTDTKRSMLQRSLQETAFKASRQPIRPCGLQEPTVRCGSGSRATLENMLECKGVFNCLALVFVANVIILQGERGVSAGFSRFKSSRRKSNIWI